MSTKRDFPLNYFKDILKIAKKYIDLAYLDINGYIKGRPDEGGLGEYMVIPAKPEKLADIAPLVFNIDEVTTSIRDYKAKNVSYYSTDTTFYLNDETIEGGPTMIDIPAKKYLYPKFVEHVWSNLGKYKFRKITDEEMDGLNAYNVVTMDAYYPDDPVPIQIILSGKDFKLSKDLKGIYVAAVIKDTKYQEKCGRNHVVVDVKYESCDVYLLCGVV